MSTQNVEQLTSQRQGLHSDTLDREARLEQIRHEAEQRNMGQLPPAYAQPGYYGVPLLKSPGWSKEIPIYFFVGGAAGAAAIIAACAGAVGRDDRLAQDARWVAAIGGAISPALLIADLGMPSRFLNMFRVFKVQSPMSVGSWTLLVFSNSAAGSVLLHNLSGKKTGIRMFANVSDFMAAMTGMVLATYTGVLIGATALPVWNENASMLPVHFGASGLASAVSILELLGNRPRALNILGTAAALTETAVGAGIEIRRKAANEPLKKGKSGWITRVGGVLSGPLPLALRLFAGNSENARSMRFRRMAAISALVGSMFTRFAWVHAGSASAKDAELALGTAGNHRRANREFDEPQQRSRTAAAD
jgi:formate-dependent nitrite reductase membrane component NrfD